MSSSKKRRDLAKAQNAAMSASMQMATHRSVAAMWEAGARELQRRHDLLEHDNRIMADCIRHIIDEVKLTSAQYEMCRAALAGTDHG